MPCQLPGDCLNEIFKYLKEDKITLHSCLLVNRLYCEIVIEILWSDVWNFHTYFNLKPHVSLSIIGTLVACLPNESKDLLHKNGIFIITPTQKPPLFNYASFFKVISIPKLNCLIIHTFKIQQTNTSKDLNHDKCLLLSGEILKMFMNQISSLKSLDCHSWNLNIVFICLPRAKICLSNLVEFKCYSDICSEFFYQISRICHNIQSLTIYIRDDISDGLTNLISSQII